MGCYRSGSPIPSTSCAAVRCWSTAIAAPSFLSTSFPPTRTLFLHRLLASFFPLTVILIQLQRLDVRKLTHARDRTWERMKKATKTAALCEARKKRLHGKSKYVVEQRADWRRSDAIDRLRTMLPLARRVALRSQTRHGKCNTGIFNLKANAVGPSRPLRLRPSWLWHRTTYASPTPTVCRFLRFRSSMIKHLILTDTYAYINTLSERTKHKASLEEIKRKMNSATWMIEDNKMNTIQKWYLTIKYLEYLRYN